MKKIVKFLSIHPINNNVIQHLSISSDNSKSGENRRRKAMGLPLGNQYDCQVAEKEMNRIS